MELDVIREYKSPCTYKLIKYFAVLRSVVASKTWISQSIVDMSINAICMAARAEVILDIGGTINFIKDLRKL